MKIAIAREAIEVGERRVALIPALVKRLAQPDWYFLLEANAGGGSFIPDADYVEAGAAVVADKAELWGNTDVLLKVAPPSRDEVNLLPEGSTLISFLNPLGDPELIKLLADRRITAFSMELIPRTSRAQSMDALSSQAGIAGYKAVLLGAAALPKFFPMLTTAAGTIRPAKVFVMGAGVAGLQAIATARRLGAIVEAFDIRPAVKEEVQSLGAKFVEIDLGEDTVAAGGYAKEVSEAAKQKTQAVLTEHIANSDVVITTAQVPGKRAPILVTAAMVEGMAPGSVIVDLAANQGGNCEVTDPGKDINYHGVTVIGPTNLPSSMPIHASQLYAKNIATLLQYLVKDNAINLDFEDDIIRDTCITHAGEIRSDRVKTALGISSEVQV
ncbi:Re/Si-specific NAD(P)(+) transhydrogenase subunit alpha [Spirulina major CS-329]|uniref:Re/Si-specific NAD(P)(+) transhydrogenase subunit alpha n=1 Tax=Spirulina TaxID=1154 RepID=UPI00232F533B|nr:MULTISPECIES: Re/Si-specific NAD(P)(+) transhydrogenase subunit alpha [Spirulina]MDB9493677.1 Re/Si-specific NAD(P)(+) transhydrogenase subunit alpha [Spirulina subsalsa CS-330]MDB9503656.1 Re/Si-specific NAD(P)(+) transhydrogenase subunit alpha [Spirulina major CS-329]